MIYYLFVFVAGILLSFGFIYFLTSPFQRLAECTCALLDVLLNQEMTETEKHRLVIQRFKGELTALFYFLIGFVATLAITLLPIYFFVLTQDESYKSLDTSSWKFWLAITLGSLLPFLFSKKKKDDYSDWSKLLHRLVLDNYHIARKLFDIEKSLYYKKKATLSEDFVIVTGLARAGTTALTKLLHKKGSFSSLAYSDMPFLLSPNIWSKFHKTHHEHLKERSHGDKVLFGVNSIEALEEYFFKNWSSDSFIKENTLTEYDLDEAVYEQYLIYQSLIKKRKTQTDTYLAKNNNLLLRYTSLRNKNPKFTAICLFRNPINHAFSLLKQHQRFCQLQQKDPFILEYMDWLGHHEFGLHHKSFQFKHSDIQLNQYEKTSIEYWLAIWINYYRKILSILPSQNFHLVAYKDFLQHPNALIKQLSVLLQKELDRETIEHFINTNQYTGSVDQELLKEAQSIYEQLLAHKVLRLD